MWRQKRTRIEFFVVMDDALLGTDAPAKHYDGVQPYKINNMTILYH